MIRGLSEKLQNLQLAIGISAKQLSELVGVDVSTITRYETGEREPNILTLSKLAKVFKVTTDYLLGLEHDTSLNPLFLDMSTLTPEQVKAMRLIYHSFRTVNE